MTGVATAEVLATRLAALRAALKAARLAGWVVGREDMYQGEEVPAGDERLAFIAGFTGSAGFAVVTADHAALFSDGRYSLQMAAQTDPAYWQSFTLPDDRLEAWLAGLDMPAAARFGIDGRLVTIDGFQRFERAILDAGGQLTSHPSNLIDQIWADRPALGPATPWPIAEDVAGNSMATKLADLDAVLLAEPCDAVLVTRVDAVNWLINHRGHDLAFTPVILCFAVYHRQHGLYLLDEADRLSALDGLGLTVRPLADLGAILAAMGDSQLMIDPASLPHDLLAVVAASGVQAVRKACPVTAMKACKTDAELAGFRAAHQRDGVALVEFLAWFGSGAATGLTECVVADKLEWFRRQHSDFVAPSFATIAGSGPNGAIVHYRAMPGADRRLEADDVLLLDSGAHYRDGTTDITRTLAIGVPPADAVAAYTTVLKAHIGLARALFPAGTTGQQLDAVTRAPLWAAKMDFAHGTGHGVGHVLSVHEGPVSISKRGDKPLKPGMVLSNEPGFYQAGAWGIRIENLVAVRLADRRGNNAKDGFGGDAFLCFETLTRCPFDRRLIDPTKLDLAERDWVNAYHQTVKSALADDCSPAARSWLEAACAPL